jgi:hypothetical protein
MMLHPALHELRAFADDELSAGARGKATRHLSACQRCRDEVAWVESTQSALRAAPVLVAPARSWSKIQERIDRGDIVILPPDSVAPAIEHSPRRTVIAAILVLVLAGGAAAVVQRQAIRDWFTARSIENRSPGEATPTPVAPAPVPKPAPAPVTTQLAVAPYNGVLSVTITQPSAELRLRVRLGDQSDLELIATGPAGTGQFRSGPGRLVIENPGPGEVLLTLPRRANRVSVQVDGRTLLVLQGSEVRLLVPADTSGPEFILPVR